MKNKKILTFLRKRKLKLIIYTIKTKYNLHENQGSFHSNLLSERSLFLCNVSVKMKER